MRRITFKYLIILLLVSLLPLACQKQPEAEPEGFRDGVWTKVHYRVSVSSSTETKATLDAIDRHYLFERDDLLYVVDKTTGGNDLFGYLFLISGAGATTAVFEGDLMYFVETAPSSGRFEPERPANDLVITATLVSKTQRDNGVYTFVENNDGKIASGPNFGDGFASTFKEAVQKYSTFKADATYGNPSFSLVQETAFLLFDLSFDDDVPASLTVSVKNDFGGSGETTLFTKSSVSPDTNHKASFVAAFPGETITLSGAKLIVSDGGSFNLMKSLASVPLQGNRYYNVAKTFLNLTYFTIQARDAATTIEFTTKFRDSTYGLQYSSDGVTWTNVSVTPSFSLAAGQSVKVQGKGDKYQNSDGTTPLFTSTGPCYIYGDIMSLFCDGSYNKKTAFSGSNNNALEGTFREMTNLDIHPARPLLLSAQTLAQSCYQQMFYGSSITRAPEFANDDGGFAADIPSKACYQMFQGCTALTAAPELPANGTIATEGYRGMFYGCTAMATPPSHLAVNPVNGSNSNFMEMFQGCTSLLLSPEISATEVRSKGCQSMFSGCTALTAAPDLPAVTVAANAYNSMFNDCSSMTQGPSVLPATIMNNYCYASMFKNCSSLTAAPQIDAVTLAQYCFSEMFSECSVLLTAQDAFSFSGDIPQQACNKMFYNCAALNKAPEMLSVTGTIGTSGCNEMYSGCAQMRAAPSSLNAATVSATGYIKMFYNCAWLMDSPAITATSIGTSGCQEMFRGCTRLQNPPATLPATELFKQAYYQMFYGCTALVSAPSLPATTIPESAYNQMFYNCKALVTPPSLLATTLGTSAYQQMFFGCTKLESIPSFPAEVNWTGSVRVCYQMFQSCTSITELTGPLFGGTLTLSKGCFEDMFSHCTSLATIPNNLLPATTLAEDCYRGMFQYTNIEHAPDLLVEDISSSPNCYRYMFYSCKKLNYIKCLTTTDVSVKVGSDYRYTNKWVGDRSAGGTFVRNGNNESWTTGDHGIPSGWTVDPPITP